MMKIRRIKWLGAFLMVLLLILIGRLVDIQLWNTESFSKHKVNLIEASVKQRSQVLTVLMMDAASFMTGMASRSHMKKNKYLSCFLF